MSEKQEERQIHCESGTIAYTLTRKTVKNVNMRIREDGTVSVSANRRVPLSFIDAWVREKQAFIRRAQAKYQQRERQEAAQARNGQEAGGCLKKGERLSELQMLIFQNMVDNIYIKFRERFKERIPYPKVKLRYMTSRWGSCQPDTGKMTLNSRLIGAPEGCLEYIVVHEFAHFIEANHSKAFWDVVEGFLPDWKMRRKRLREWG